MIMRGSLKIKKDLTNLKVSLYTSLVRRDQLEYLSPVFYCTISSQFNEPLALFGGYLVCHMS